MYFNFILLFINSLNIQIKLQKEDLIDKVNAQLTANIKKIFEKQDEIFKLNNVSKLYGF